MRPFHREGNAGPKLFRESQANQKYFTLGDQRLRCSSEARRTPSTFCWRRWTAGPAITEAGGQASRAWSGVNVSVNLILV